MYQRLNDFLEEQNCFYHPAQSGLCLNYSTNNGLMGNVNLAYWIQQQLDNDNYTVGVFVDLKKSIWYDGPWHTDWKTWSVWCDKLIKTGLLHRYLKNRRQYVTNM